MASAAHSSSESESESESSSRSSLYEVSSTRSHSRPIDRLRRVKRSMSCDTIMHPDNQVRMQCMQGVDNKYYYIPLDPYNRDHLQIVDELSPLLVNPTPAQFKPGALYTYIVANIVDKNPDTGADIEHSPLKLYACKAHNMFEFGTKHHQIFYRMCLTHELERFARDHVHGPNKLKYGLHSSGEIRCGETANDLTFNFYSGTYKMRKNVPKSRVQYEIEITRDLMRSIDPSYKIKYDPVPFIVPDVMKITPAQLRHLNDNRITAYGFDTQRQCHDMRSALNRNKSMSPADMDQLYEQIMNPPPTSFVPTFTNAYIMSTGELTEYAHTHGVPIPDLPPGGSYDTETKKTVRIIIQAHMDANKGKGGGEKRTLRKKRTLK